MFEKQEFDKFILDNKVVGIKPEGIKLKSGRTSYWYANCRVLSDTYSLLSKTSQFVIDRIKELELEYDYIYGTPDGATKLGIMVNILLGKDKPDLKMVVGRKKPKEYGDPKDRYFVGPVEKGDKVLVLEDVTTTGSSVIEHIRFLKEAGIDVVAIISLVNRIEKRDDGLGVAEYIKKEFDIPYHWLSDASRLLPLAVKQGGYDEETVSKVQENVNQYGINPIELK
ncbi:orotate phosphoribosyltransferase [Thermoproteota archaeon]